MKKIMKAIIILCAATTLLVGCSKKVSTKQPEPSAITAKLQSAIKFPEMLEVKKDRLSKYYKVDTGKLKSFSVYICSSSASSDEIAVFKCDSDANADAVKTAVQKRIDDRSATFKDYGQPQEYSNIQNCVFETKGSYVILAVTGDNTKAQKTIDNFF